MKTLKSLLVATILVLAPFYAANAAFTQVISIGDSLSDVGNNGRFTNPGGLIWNEILADSLGLAQPTPSIGGGTGGAFGGARTTTTAFGFIPSAQTQANDLTAGFTAIDPNAIYTVFIGGNDVNASANSVQGAFDAELLLSGNPAAAVAAANAEAVIQAGILAAEGAAASQIAIDLVNAGAQNVLLFNVPNVALAPIAGGDPLGVVNSLSLAFNAGMASVAGISDPAISFIDSFSLITDIVNNPATYGISDVTNQCQNEPAGSGCENSFLFWDDLHPTSAGHQIIAEAALAAVVPVPAALPLFMAALAGFGAMRRLKK